MVPSEKSKIFSPGPKNAPTSRFWAKLAKSQDFWKIRNFFLNSQITLSMCLVLSLWPKYHWVICNILGFIAICSFYGKTAWKLFSPIYKPAHQVWQQLIGVKALPSEGVSPHAAKFDFRIFTRFGLGWNSLTQPLKYNVIDY